MLHKHGAAKGWSGWDFRLHASVVSTEIHVIVTFCVCVGPYLVRESWVSCSLPDLPVS
jgi:hypothetical protein